MVKCNLFSLIRKSKRLIIAIVFLSLFTDSLLLTLVDPILPDIIANLETGKADAADANRTIASADGNSTQAVNSNNTIAETTLEGSNSTVTDLINEHGRYGFLVAAKGAAQFVFNPFVGIIVTKCGYRVPMLLGDLVLLISTLAFAYGATYEMLFITRLFQVFIIVFKNILLS